MDEDDGWWTTTAHPVDLSAPLTFGHSWAKMRIYFHFYSQSHNHTTDHKSITENALIAYTIDKPICCWSYVTVHDGKHRKLILCSANQRSLMCGNQQVRVNVRRQRHLATERAHHAYEQAASQRHGKAINHNIGRDSQRTNCRATATGKLIDRLTRPDPTPPPAAIRRRRTKLA